MHAHQAFYVTKLILCASMTVCLKNTREDFTLDLALTPEAHCNAFTFGT